jgi:hypothetical protein
MTEDSFSCLVSVCFLVSELINARSFDDPKTAAFSVSAQIPSAFASIDRQRTQGRTPVRKRPLG